MSTPPSGSSRAVPAWRIAAQGDRCLVVCLGERIDADLGRLCLGLARQIRQARLPGVTDVVPSFVAVAVHYQPGCSFAQMAQQIEALLEAGIAAERTSEREIEIPVCYGGVYGPDLEPAARACGLAPEALIALHGQAPLTVFMLGFAPGLPYLGLLDPKLDLPRRDSPRTAVPAGSVGIAIRQTVIYPDTLPGGWHLIGATPLPMFDHRREPPALLQPGDRVRFVPIAPERYRQLRAQRNAPAERHDD